MTATTGRVFHLQQADAWAVLAPEGGAPATVAGEQFERHGFVHCCFREQLTEIASWWFEPGDELVALELDPSRLTPELRLEASPSRWYPHLYGPIDGPAVVAAHPVPRDVDGVAELPRDLRRPPPGYQVTGRLPGREDEAVVRWTPGRLDGDAEWIAAAAAAQADGRLVPLIGGVLVPPTLARAYESFALLDLVADRIVRYDGDGFF